MNLFIVNLNNGNEYRIPTVKALNDLVLKNAEEILPDLIASFKDSRFKTWYASLSEVQKKDDLRNDGDFSHILELLKSGEDPDVSYFLLKKYGLAESNINITSYSNIKLDSKYLLISQIKSRKTADFAAKIVAENNLSDMSSVAITNAQLREIIKNSQESKEKNCCIKIILVRADEEFHFDGSEKNIEFVCYNEPVIVFSKKGEYDLSSTKFTGGKVIFDSKYDINVALKPFICTDNIDLRKRNISLCRIKEVSAGADFSLVLLSDGSLYGFGNNQAKQIADTSVEEYESPFLMCENVLNASGGKNYTAIISREGVLSMRGNSELCKLEEEVRNLKSVCARSSNCAVIDNDNHFHIWGDNDSYQISRTENNSLIKSKSFLLDKYAVPTDEVRLEESKKAFGRKVIVEKAASHYKERNQYFGTRGEYYTYHDATHYNLKIFGEHASYIPICKYSNVCFASLGNEHICIISNHGEVFVWGNNQHGRLGYGAQFKSDTPYKIFDDALQVSAGLDHTLILRKDGKLFGCGNNKSGQILKGAAEIISAPLEIMQDVTSISAGSHFSMAIKSNGDLYAWGANHCGRLGFLTDENISEPRFVLSEVVSVSAGAVHTLSADRYGNLYSWGANSSCQLGCSDVISPENQYIATPRKVLIDYDR